jgi:hypothetical protein
MASRIRQWFLTHPASVGESYSEHFGVAARFGFAMLRGGIACLVHALFPALCERTGSGAVKALYSEMVARQPDCGRLVSRLALTRPAGSCRQHPPRRASADQDAADQFSEITMDTR